MKVQVAGGAKLEADASITKQKEDFYMNTSEKEREGLAFD